MAALSLSIRVLHVLGMAVLVGGGAFAWHELRRTDRPVTPLVVRYEWVFWGTLGVMLVTGVGNLGELGPPGPGTRWGELLTLKLAAVVGFVVASVLRSLAVLRLRDRGVPPTDAVRRVHALTVAALVGIVVLAEVLAHG